MRFVKNVTILIIAILIAGKTIAQNDTIARAYRRVNVRSGPGTQYAIIGQLNSGNEVRITGRSNDDSDWLRIDFQGSDGWLAYFTVTVFGDVNRLDIVAPREDQSSLPTRSAPTSIAPEALSNVFVTAYRRVNVRNGPGSDYSSIGNLEAGTRADVIGRSNDDEWLQIDFGGKSGWVAFFVVSLTGSLENTDIVLISSEIATEEPPGTLTIVTRYNTNLHEQPSLASSILGVVPFNTKIQADSRNDVSGTWVHIQDSTYQGWLLSSLTTVRGDLTKIPVSQLGYVDR